MMLPRAEYDTNNVWKVAIIRIGFRREEGEEERIWGWIFVEAKRDAVH